jgi:hypothetical protein
MGHISGTWELLLRGTCGSWERNAKIWIDFRKSSRFSLISPLSQEREKSSRPVFTMCGERAVAFKVIGGIEYSETCRKRLID